MYGKRCLSEEVKENPSNGTVPIGNVARDDERGDR